MDVAATSQAILAAGSRSAINTAVMKTALNADKAVAGLLAEAAANPVAAAPAPGTGLVLDMTV